jgi:SAM-dependent methyltransferase
MIPVHEQISTKDARRAPLGAAAAAHPQWPALRAALLAAASARYRGCGRFAYHFARGKLGGDPVFRAILEHGWLRGSRRILDLGCGQGLLAAWLRAASECRDLGLWPSAWPAPPAPESIRGIELSAVEVARARRALGPECEVLQADIRRCAFGRADAVVILDVLHYLPAEAQQEVLKRAHAALPPGGLLLTRVADAAGGARFRFTRAIDAAVLLARGHGLARLCCHSVPQWRALLRSCGFESRAEPMSAGTPFANVLLLARAL